jgi:hypothetical protein
VKEEGHQNRRVSTSSTYESMHVAHHIPQTPFFLIVLKSIYLSTNRGTCHHLRCRVYNYSTFCKVLDVSSECMVKREELSMFVKRRILATLPQPNELQSCLAYWAWELPVNTPSIEYPITPGSHAGSSGTKHAF